MARAGTSTLTLAVPGHYYLESISSHASFPVSFYELEIFLHVGLGKDNIDNPSRCIDRTFRLTSWLSQRLSIDDILAATYRGRSIGLRHEILY